jgi:hypothetical protein
MPLLRKLAPLIILAVIAAATVAVLTLRDSADISSGPSRVPAEGGLNASDTL